MTKLTWHKTKNTPPKTYIIRKHNNLNNFLKMFESTHGHTDTQTHTQTLCWHARTFSQLVRSELSWTWTLLAGNQLQPSDAIRHLTLEHSRCIQRCEDMGSWKLILAKVFPTDARNSSSTWKDFSWQRNSQAIRSCQECSLLRRVVETPVGLGGNTRKQRTPDKCMDCMSIWIEIIDW